MEVKGIYSSIIELLDDNLIGSAASYLQEDPAKVTATTHQIVAGLLYSIPYIKDSSEIEPILKQAGKNYPIIIDRILPDIFAGKANERIYYLGSRFLDAIFGNRVNTFTSLISTNSQLSIRHVDKLISITAPLVASFLGNKILFEGLSFSNIVTLIKSERSQLMKVIPEQLPEVFELLGTKHKTISNEIVHQSEVAAAPSSAHPKKSLGWLFISVVLLIVIVSLFLWIKSCH